VVPNHGLAVGSYTATVTVSGDDGIRASFAVSFLVKPVPDHGISLSETGTLLFEDAVLGYTAQDAKTITITNIGDQPTGELTLNVSNGDFTLSKQTIDSIAVDGSDSFTVVPKTGLEAGDYTATVTVSGGSNIEEQSFEVSFTVTLPPSYLTLTNGANVKLTVANLGVLCSNSTSAASINVNGQSIVKNTIAGAVFGTDFSGVTALPARFCMGFSKLTALDLSGFTALTSIGDYFMLDCVSFNSTLTIQTVTSIGHYFMRGCKAFNKALTLPPSTRSIGNNFLSGYPTVLAFNSTLTLPEGLTSIGDALLSDIPSYNQPLTIPASVTYVGTHFLVNCNNMTSVVTVRCPATAFAASNESFGVSSASAPGYVTGIRITGPSATDIVARFPARTSNPFRNLIAENGVTLDVNGTHTFPSAFFNYGAQTPKTVNIINSGSQATGSLTLALSGANSASFTLNSPTTAASVAAGTSAPFTVVPKTDLAVGTHTATVTVSGSGAAGNGLPRSFNVSFTVMATYGIALNVSGTSFFPSAFFGYGAQSAKTFNITNTGSQPTGDLTLSNSNASAFTLTPASTVVSIAAGATRSFTVTPVAGLAGGTHTATITVSGSNGLSASFGVSFTVTATYGIELNMDGDYPFEDAILGYGAQTPLEVTVRNSGNQDTGELAIGVTGAVPSGGFTLSKTAIANIAVDGSDSFTVVPKTGLAEGTHTATVTVSGGSNIEEQSFEVSFTVTDTPSYLTLTDGTTVTIGADDLEVICANAYAADSMTVNGQSIVRNTVTAAVFGSAFSGVTQMPNAFCLNFTSLTALDMSGFTSLTGIGGNFLFYCGAFNESLALPSVTTIGGYFMSGCGAFNKTLTLPSVTTIGNNFMSNCGAFNKTLTLPSVTTIGGYFMSACSAFAQPLDLPSLTAIGNSFMSNCNVFYQPLTLPSVTTIGSSFMSACTGFNKSLTLPSVTAIGNDFMFSCRAFNQPLALPSGLNTIGNNFMHGCTTFNRPLTVPASLTAIGTYFIAYCDSMTSAVTVLCPATVFAESDYSFVAGNAIQLAYTEGIPIAGPSAAAMMARFPNSDSVPFRKLKAATQ
jgi:uncharacterized membrane protein